MVSKRDHNKLMHSLHGNIKLLHLNKSNCNILTKIDLIQDLINQEQPGIISLNESNVTLAKPKETKPFKDYQFEHKSIKVNGITGSMARTTLAIHDKIHYERMYSLETDVNSIIWIKVNIKGHNQVLVMSGYRQQSILKELRVKNSSKIRKQISRLTSFIESYSWAASLGLDIVIMQDSNIDTNPKVDYSLKYNSKEMFDMWMDAIVTNNWPKHNFEFT